MILEYNPLYTNNEHTIIIITGGYIATTTTRVDTTKCLILRLRGLNT